MMVITCGVAVDVTVHEVALDMTEGAALCPGSSSTQCLVRQLDTFFVSSWIWAFPIFFYVMVNSDLEVASCPALHCRGDVCSVDAPVALLSGFHVEIWTLRPRALGPG